MILLTAEAASALLRALPQAAVKQPGMRISKTFESDQPKRNHA